MPFRGQLEFHLRIFDSDSFAFVYSSIVLQHLEPRYQKRYLSEFIRVLAPGGLLVFQLPSEPIVLASDGWMGGVKAMMRSAAPSVVLLAYRKLRLELTGIGKGARMEMWGTHREEVEAHLLGHGALVLDVQPDSRASRWMGFRYAVSK